MPTVDLAGARWRKSSRTAGMGNANCVEVTFAGPAAAVRDSKNPTGPVIVVPASAWHRFVAAIKHGALG
ncbi:DUF397 domain-containing protein [Gandjariella thermophila]|uniref:DUF397 domain-containing protein n=1 Tax=Gandjariella thermophila TaxID=1931992 RepID=A0A4D4IWM1_9PSEU|nr:DUF397 domain-containing protein [Gandjariella thermophila]GDY28745.1 DUF397 domain-containing protein [Gandjariella thermophila]